MKNINKKYTHKHTLIIYILLKCLNTLVSGLLHRPTIQTEPVSETGSFHAQAPTE
jgi:hypothetical protein